MLWLTSGLSFETLQMSYRLLGRASENWKVEQRIWGGCCRISNRYIPSLFESRDLTANGCVIAIACAMVDEASLTELVLEL